MAANEVITCKNCEAESSGRHCYNCGQKLETGRITLHSILHEVFHYFTHLDNGFGYTLKQLVTRPGRMQKEFIEGKRSRHQKPFSMFFLCGTISGLGYYFIIMLYENLYQEANAAEADFFRHYFVLLQAVMLPVYTLVLWLLFKNSKKNYAEMLVLSLYLLSFVFLVFIFINAVKLVFPNFENRYAEIIFLLFYNNLTNVRFFSEKKGIVIAKTILMLAINYALAQLVMNQILIKLIQ